MRDSHTTTTLTVAPFHDGADLAGAQPRCAADAQAIHDGRAPATWKAYRADWAHWERWCEVNGRGALPSTPATLTAYLHALVADGYHASTIQRRLSTIAVRHRGAGWGSPTQDELVKSVWRGLRRQLGERGRTAPRQAAPATTDVIARMLATLDQATLIGARDRALLLLGFAGALRRSELVALDVADVAETPDGLKLRIRRSKTDQEATGRTVGVPYGSQRQTCPVRAWGDWLAASGITTGPAWRPVSRHGHLGEARLSDRAVSEIVKRSAQRAGLDPAEFSGRSLRAGLITAAAAAGVPAHVIQRQSGHKTLGVLHGYIREGDVFRDNAAAKVGLSWKPRHPSLVERRLRSCNTRLRTYRP
jgi:site-specific recombinase XerD